MRKQDMGVESASKIKHQLAQKWILLWAKATTIQIMITIIVSAGSFERKQLQIKTKTKCGAWGRSMVWVASGGSEGSEGRKCSAEIMWVTVAAIYLLTYLFILIFIVKILFLFFLFIHYFLKCFLPHFDYRKFEGKMFSLSLINHCKLLVRTLLVFNFLIFFNIFLFIFVCVNSKNR